MQQKAQQALRGLISDAIDQAQFQKCENCVVKHANELAKIVLRKSDACSEARELALLIITRNTLRSINTT